MLQWACLGGAVTPPGRHRGGGPGLNMQGFLQGGVTTATKHVMQMQRGVRGVRKAQSSPAYVEVRLGLEPMAFERCHIVCLCSLFLCGVPESKPYHHVRCRSGPSTAAVSVQSFSVMLMSACLAMHMAEQSGQRTLPDMPASHPLAPTHAPPTDRFVCAWSHPAMHSTLEIRHGRNIIQPASKP